MLRRHERQRRRRHDVQDRRELVRRSRGRRDEPGNHVHRRRKHQDAADDLVHRVELVTEPGRHAKIAAAATEGPEEVGMRVGVHAQELAVGRHDVRRQKAVHREAMFPGEIPDAATQRDATNPHRTGVAKARRQTVGPNPSRVTGRRQPRFRPCGARGDVDLERLHRAQIEHDAPVGRAVAGTTVTAAANRELDAILAREGDDLTDTTGVDRLHDGPRPPVEPAHEERAGLIVAGVIGRDHPALHDRAQFRKRNRSARNVHEILLPGTRSTVLMQRRVQASHHCIAVVSKRSDGTHH